MIDQIALIIDLFHQLGACMMDRLEHLREVIDEILRQQPDQVESRCGFVHLYGVSSICAVLALKRGLDVELSTTAGMLHDIWSYKTGSPTNHAELGAIEARKILQETGNYTSEEIETIASAISHHSNKDEIHDNLSELLKDADVLQHYLYNPLLPKIEAHAERLNDLHKELGLI